MSILQRNKKVAVGVGVAAAAAAAIALGTGTYAAWTAQAPGPSGTFAAGTMTLTVGAAAGSAVLFEANNLFPGQAPTTTTIEFTNDSPVDAYLTGADTFSGEDGGTDGSAQLRYQLTQASDCTTPSGVHKGTTATALNNVGENAVDKFIVKAHEKATCTFTFALPESADDHVQGDKIKVSSTFTLTQKTSTN